MAWDGGKKSAVLSLGVEMGSSRVVKSGGRKIGLQLTGFESQERHWHLLDKPGPQLLLPRFLNGWDRALPAELGASRLRVWMV